MRLRYINSVILTACCSICLIACNKSGLVATPQKSLHITINEQSHSTANPLILVDGIKFDDFAKVKIDPSDIKSMTVLNSNSTNNLVDTYGPKAKDGVILVITKRGK